MSYYNSENYKELRNVKTADEALTLIDKSSSVAILYYHDKEDYEAWLEWLKALFPKLFDQAKLSRHNKFDIEPFKQPGYFKLDIDSYQDQLSSGYASAPYTFITANTYSSYRFRAVRRLHQFDAHKNLYSRAPEKEQLKTDAMSDEELYVYNLIKDIDKLEDD